MNFSFKSHATKTAKTSVAFALTAASLSLVGCDNASPPRAMPNTPPVAVAQASATQAPTMQTGMEAIKACKANGLEEASCTQVYHDMMAGRPPQGAATLADCETKYGAGQCGNNPVPNASGSGSVFLPLVAGAALGALGGYLLAKNLAPKGAYVPPTDWLKNRPAISAPQNPVAGGAAAGKGVSAYAQAPGTYKVGDAKVAGVGGGASTQFTPPAGGAKAGAMVSPAAQSSSAFKQGAATSAYATGARPSSGYGNSAYTTRPSQPLRPGSRSLGTRR